MHFKMCYITVVASRYWSCVSNMSLLKLSGVIVLFSVGIYVLK